MQRNLTNFYVHKLRNAVCDYYFSNKVIKSH